MLSLGKLEKVAGWVGFYATVIPASYCFARSFLCKLMQFIFQDEFQCSDPRLLPFTRLSAALESFRPMHFDSEQRRKWNSASCVYLLALLLLISAVHPAANDIFLGSFSLSVHQLL